MTIAARTRDPATTSSGLTARYVLGRGEPTTLHLVGEVDGASVGPLSALAQCTIAVVDDALQLDLTELTFVDVRGCRSIESFVQRCRAAGMAVVVGPMSPQMKRMWTFTSADERCPRGPLADLTSSQARSKSGKTGSPASAEFQGARHGLEQPTSRQPAAAASPVV